MAAYGIDGRQPPLQAGAWIAPGAHVIGQVVPQARAGVWFGAIVRRDNTCIDIGMDSSVQDGAILHSDPGFPLVVGPRVSIGHRAMLHGCTIGQGSLVGMGARVMNGAAVGEHSLVAANALITGHTVFPRAA